MRHKMSHSLRRILYGLALLVAAVSAAPQKDSISNSRMGKPYVDEVMRHAKAAEIQSYMKETSDPCDNFYEFACGNFARINQADINHLTTGLFERLSDAFDRKVKQELSRENDRHDTQEDIQVRNFFKSCKRVTTIDDKYQKSLRDLIKQFGSMPLLEQGEWNESSFDWVNTTASIHYHYGHSIILSTEVSKDLVNNTVNVVYVVQQDFPLETRGMYLMKEMAIYRQKYMELVAKSLHTFLDVELEKAIVTARELMNFEVQLAKALMDETDDVDLMEITKMMTIEQIQKLYPTLHLKKLVDVSIGEEIKIVYDFLPQYKANLVKVMKETPKRIVANYIFYRLIDEFTLNPGKTEVKRALKCLDTTRKFFAKPLDRMIYRQYNTNETAANIESMWTEIKQTFKEKLESNSITWISDSTRNLALKKLEAMRFQINSYEDEDMSKDFKDMHLLEDSYIENLMNVYRVRAFQERDLLHQPIKPLEMSETLSFTPANILLENLIKVPVAVLQPNYLWASSYPNAIKFGTLGALIGHELIHGFDTQGRKFDALGNINDWWDEASTHNFVGRQSCFTRQYSKFTYNGRRLPETEAQSENIADNGGVRLAYSAYIRWLSAQGNSATESLGWETLPTLDYTNKQLFFISYAQIWCNDVHPKVRDLQIATDDHVPGKFRVIGPLANFDEFAKSFQCQKRTVMNPTEQCLLY